MDGRKTLEGRCADIVRRLVEVNDARSYIASPDASFRSILRQVFTVYCCLHPDRIAPFEIFDDVLAEVKKSSGQHQLLLFIEHDMDNEAVYANMGYVCSGASQFRKAISCLEPALECNPGNRKARSWRDTLRGARMGAGVIIRKRSYEGMG